MAHRNHDTLIAWTKVLAPAFTKPGRVNALLVFCGWVLTRGSHAVTQALVELGIQHHVHHERLHRFFSRGTWSVDELGRLLFAKIAEHFGSGDVLTLVIDDTLVSHKGPKIFGLGSHVDAVRSSRLFRVFSFGHVWVVLAVCVRVPFSRRTWALPILFRLYRPESTCKRGQPPFKTKTQLAHEMLAIVAQWAAGRPLRITADCAYANSTVLTKLPSNVVFIGAMRPDAALTALPSTQQQPSTGRRRMRGERLPSPADLAKAPSQRWRSLDVHIYGKRTTLEVKVYDAQWYRVARCRHLRVVLVRVLRGDLPVRVFFSTDPSLPVETIITAYAARWGVEVCFRELKQHLGFGDSSARTRNAVERVTPFSGYLYTVLALWFCGLPNHERRRAAVHRPWYRTKHGYSFEDILRAAQGVLRELDVSDLLHGYADLQAPPPPSPRRRATRLSGFS
jgi:hypothetical protein